MSLEQTAYVERGSVPDRVALQAVIDSTGFDCKLDGSYKPFESQGFLPCILNGQSSGFEIYFEPAAAVLEQFPDLAQMIGSREAAITFRWGGDMAECACVLIVSAALAKAFGAIVHYQEDDMVYSAEQLVQEARSALLSLDQTKPLAENYDGSFAADAITVEAGNLESFAFHDVNIIGNYDPDIGPDRQPRSWFQRLADRVRRFLGLDRSD